MLGPLCVGCLTTTVTGSSGGTAGRSQGSSGSSGGSTTGPAGTGGTTGFPVICQHDGGEACTRFGSSCGCNSDCCSDECKLGSCAAQVDASCFNPSDCGSDSCVDQTCACSNIAAPPAGDCVSDSDCCDGIQCTLYQSDGGYDGSCCTPLGESCAQGE